MFLNLKGNLLLNTFLVLDDMLIEYDTSMYQLGMDN